MSRVSRRKTLSHSEIENFLSEINVDQKQGLTKDTDKPMALTSNCPAIAMVEVTVADPMRTEVQAVRDFCKATFQTYRQGKNLEPSRELCDVGRKILTGSTYPILSTRLLRPENYLYPSSSLEGKKSLLLSLSPMLSDAEEQRQKETSACESFTRCSSGKGKGKYSTYVYTDVDVKCQVDFPEYEKRYMLYIGQNKKTYSKTTPMSPSLNYLTLQHRQRKAERQSILPKRNLQSILDGQMGEENRKISNSPNQSVSKLFNKPKIEPVKLDDSTMELVSALMKPSRANTHIINSHKSDAMEVVAVALPACTTATAVVPTTRTVTVPTPAKRPEEVVRSPFAALCEVNAPVQPTLASLEPVGVVAPEEQSLSMEVHEVAEQEVFVDDAINSSGGNNDRKRKHGRGARLLARRGTLSPASVRAMLLEVMDPAEPVLSAAALPEPLLEASVFSDDCTAADLDCVALHSVITTPMKSKVSTPHTSPMSCSNVEQSAEAAHTSPFSIRTALELRRTPSKAKTPSPIATQLRAETEEVESEVEGEHTQSCESQCVDAEHSEHAKKVARSGSPSTSTVIRTASPASCLFVTASVSALPVSLDMVVDAQLVAAVDGDKVAHADVNEIEVASPVESVECSSPVMESKMEMSSSTTPASPRATAASTEMEVIEDFGRELDSMLCDVSCIEPSSPFTFSRPSAVVALGSVAVRQEQEVACPPVSPSVDAPASPAETDDSLAVLVEEVDETPEPHSESISEIPVAVDMHKKEEFLPASNTLAVETVPGVVEKEVKQMFDTPQKMPASESVARSPAMAPFDLPPLASSTRALPSNSSTPASWALSSVSKVHISSASSATRVAIIPPTPPSMPRTRSALSPKVAHLSPFGCKSGTSSKASSPGERDTSMDDSCLMFCEHDEDLEAFEMLESMVEKEFETAREGGLNWDFSDISCSETTLPLTAHSTESSPEVSKPVRVENESVGDQMTSSTPLEGACQVCEDAKSTASLAPHPRTPQKKTPEQRSAGSSERKRRGLTFIPRYAVSPAALSNALNCSALDVSTCTALAASETEVSIADIVLSTEFAESRESAEVSVASTVSVAVPESIYPDSVDLAAAQVRAKARYEERLQVARWQYEWELVSAELAHAVVQRNSKQ